MSSWETLNDALTRTTNMKPKTTIGATSIQQVLDDYISHYICSARKLINLRVFACTNCWSWYTA